MSLAPAAALRALALAQAMVVAGPLGDSYAGRSAQTLSGLLLMLAADLETRGEREARARAGLVALLSEARIADAALAARTAALLGEAGQLPPEAGLDRLFQGFIEVHRWADAADPGLARRCRAFLADWAEGERLPPPLLATVSGASG
ncbi:hypothetical protein [Thermaurantiacus sp.]